jgi:hypothetical protein
MFEKISVREIISDHLDTLRAYDTKRRSVSDLVLFFIVPLILGILLARIRPQLTPELAGVLATSLSVFAALLFNLILLIYDIIDRTLDSPEAVNKKREFLNQIYSNVSFCILACILTLLILLLDFLNLIIWRWLQTLIAFGVYYMVGVFILTLFMVLKRIHVLMRREVNRR